MQPDEQSAAKSRSNVLECGGKRSATPLYTVGRLPKAVSPLRFATAVQNLLFVTFVAILLALVAMLGCTTMPGSNTPLTLNETQLDVSWKMTAYRQADTAGSVTEAQAQAVTTANQAYWQAYRQAVTNAGGNLDAPTPPNLQAVVNQLLAAIDNVLTTLTP